MPEILIQTAKGARDRYRLGKPCVTIGRSRECDIVLADQWLSRQHAQIVERGEGFHLSDKGSKNGTLLNGQLLLEERRLRDGDVITLGEHILTFSDEQQPETEDVPEPVGTQVFSARELSDAASRPTADPDALARQNRVLGLIAKSTNALLEHLSLPELFDRILDLLLDSVAAERAAILLIEGTPPQPVIKASKSRSGEPIARVSRSIARHVLEERVSLILPNVMDNAAFRSQDSILSSGIRSALCAPLWHNVGGGNRDAVIGLVYLDSLLRSRALDEEDLQAVTAFANVAAAKIENTRLLEENIEKRRLEQEMQVAAEIQRSMLPRGAPQVSGYELVGSNAPCHTVGGDYYDFALENGRLLLALGDVSGKGTGAALLMAVLRAAVRANWGREAVADAVGHINQTACQNVPEGKFITFFLAQLEPTTGELSYVNAGHNLPVLVRKSGSVESLETGGPVLGVFESIAYEKGRTTIEQGDVLVVFSDGVSETWNPADEEFGEARLREVVVGARGSSAPEILRAVLDAAERFGEGTKATDDRTMIVLKRP
jgi:phosphoserine phosphatase RsbU/P